MACLTKSQSFPRKRESTASDAYFQEFSGWIPAFAGMTANITGGMWSDCEYQWRHDATAKSGANVIDELQREYDDLKRRALELRSFL